MPRAIRNLFMAGSLVLVACVNVDEFDARGRTPLMWAAQRGDTTRVLRLIAEGADVNAEVPSRDLRELIADVTKLEKLPKSDIGFTPLIYAAKGGHPRVVRILIDSGADPKHFARYGETAIGFALDRSDVAMARMLTATGARPNDRLFAGAVAKSPAAMVEVLLKAGANANGRSLPDPQRGRPYEVFLLITAAERGDPDVVKALIDAGARVNVRDRNGWTALRWARDPEAQRSNARASELVTVLEAAGARDTVGSKADALFRAVEKGDVAGVKQALRSGAPPDSRDKQGITPLIRAAYAGSAPIVAALVAGGANVNRAPTNFAATPLTAAVERGNIEAVKAILAAGARADRRDGRGWSPLFVATNSGHSNLVPLLLRDSVTVDDMAMNAGAQTHDTTIVQLLLAHGGNPDRALNSAIWACGKQDNAAVIGLLLGKGAKLTQNTGLPYMNRAALRCGAESIRLLVRYGADVNERDWTGDTPLITAASKGNLENVKALIAAGADLSIKDNADRSALRRAWRYPLVKQEIQRAQDSLRTASR